jgi:hypothetical protein
MLNVDGFVMTGVIPSPVSWKKCLLLKVDMKNYIEVEFNGNQVFECTEIPCETYDGSEVT